MKYTLLKVFNGCFPEEVETGGDYAETDLDQLTDYSLRYNEEQQDSSNSSFNKVCLALYNSSYYQ
jgi:hypothetical protein